MIKPCFLSESVIVHSLKLFRFLRVFLSRRPATKAKPGPKPKTATGSKKASKVSPSKDVDEEHDELEDDE